MKFMRAFEEAFGDFIDGEMYDEVEKILFSIVRAAYIAGWMAAGGSLEQLPRHLTAQSEDDTLLKP